MTNKNWQLNQPIDAIIFDCDGTLSQIEGIDELAKQYNQLEVVANLTAKAMQDTGLNPELYNQRLNLIKPKQEDLQHLGEVYSTHQTAYAREVIHVLQRLNKSVYILSAGLEPAVQAFGAKLNIPHENIFAVSIHFSEQGNYLDFDRQSPLIHNHGKGEILKNLAIKHKRTAHIGDGINDVIAKDIVTRFIGFGGYSYRENIAACADFYLKIPSLLPLLPLLLTPEEMSQFNDIANSLYEQSIKQLLENFSA